jgi:hypothetical protein
VKGVGGVKASNRRGKRIETIGRIKPMVAIVLLLIFFVSIIFCLNTFFKRNYIGPVEQMNEPIKKGDLFYVTRDALRDPSKFKVVDDSKELLLVEAVEETSLAKAGKWPNNLKMMQYAIRWKPECDLLPLPKEIYIVTNNKFNISDLRSRIPKSSMFQHISIDTCSKNSECTYKMQLYFDYGEACLAEFRIPLQELLKKMGFTNFIIH